MRRGGDEERESVDVTLSLGVRRERVIRSGDGGGQKFA